jgi:hypothetical protein
MATSERLHRPDPERTAPIRDATTYLRDAPSSDLDPSAADAPQQHSEAPESVVAHGVRLGYKVIEEQIVQGQRLAQRLGKTTSAKLGGAGSGDVAMLVERVLDLYRDVGALCVDVVAQSSSLRARRSRFSRPMQSSPDAAEHAPAASAAAPPANGMRFAIEVTSAYRTRVALDLQPGWFVPKVHALHAADSSCPPLTAVSFDLEAGRPAPRLNIEVPDGQPPATYTGVIVDSVSNEPRGTLSVRLLP